MSIMHFSGAMMQLAPPAASLVLLNQIFSTSRSGGSSQWGAGMRLNPNGTLDQIRIYSGTPSYIAIAGQWMVPAGAESGSDFEISWMLDDSNVSYTAPLETSWLNLGTAREWFFKTGLNSNRYFEGDFMLRRVGDPSSVVAAVIEFRTTA